MGATLLPMKRVLGALTLYVGCVLAQGGCGGADEQPTTAELGECDEDKARALLVAPDGRIEYAGQAIINRSCAAGACHASNASGDERFGAPSDVNLDLEPAFVVDGGTMSGASSLDANALGRLQRNQQRVYDLSGQIWALIKSGAEPPDKPHGNASAGGAVQINDDSCSSAPDQLAPITAPSTQELVRNWLACGAPVVEVSDPSIPLTTLEHVPPGRPGTVGQQFPGCDEAP